MLFILIRFEINFGRIYIYDKLDLIALRAIQSVSLENAIRKVVTNVYLSPFTYVHDSSLLLYSR